MVLLICDYRAMTPEQRAHLSRAAKAAWTPERRRQASETWHEVRARNRARPSRIPPDPLPTPEEWAELQKARRARTAIDASMELR